MRYTEIRMAKIAHELLADIDKETVDFGPNYDGSEHEPLIMPAKIPNLLINGSSGIAVGMATNIPPHNLNEVIDACLAVLKDPQIGIEDLIEIVPAPDFPTAGIIYGLSGVKDGYRTGRGRVVMRAKCHFEDIDKAGNRQAIIVDELPYQVNKANLLIKIGELVKEKRLEGISELRDESDKSGMRMVIELKRGEVPEVVLNKLYKDTQMQDTFGMNMVALLDGQPRLLNLKQMLEAFLRHRREVITRRTKFELKKARERGHVLEGLAVALANVDEIIAMIKASATPAEAKAGLMTRAWRSPLVEEMLARAQQGDAYRPTGLAYEFGLHPDGYHLTDVQAQAILDLRLQRLTGLEQDKILGEYREVVDRITDLLDILDKPERVTAIITEELNAIKNQFGDKRRSEIVTNAQEFSLEDLITPQEVVVTPVAHRLHQIAAIDDYRTQKRGGRGKQAAATKEEDFIENLFIANTHDTILCFTNKGRLFWLKVYEVPQSSRTARGKPIVNLLKLEDGELVNALLPVKEFTDNQYIFMVTAFGTVKKTPLSEFSRPRSNGIIAVSLDEGDHLVGVAITDGQHDVMLFSDEGKANRFEEQDVRPMGRTARGVRGMKLGAGAQVISPAGRRERPAIGAHRDRKRLRQTHADQRIHAPQPWRPGHDRYPDHCPQRQGGRRHPGRPGRRDHAHHYRRCPDSHPASAKSARWAARPRASP
jgi:DNA gyrase subunit A